MLDCVGRCATSPTRIKAVALQNMSFSPANTISYKTRPLCNPGRVEPGATTEKSSGCVVP